MNYLSVCSGIEAATVAWHHMGWNPVGFSEIEKFPSQVLAHHYQNVTNYGDMTKFKEWNINESVELLVGGTPCQSFSVAGLRKGLDDPRGNLMLTYLAMADYFKPKWLLWENVPGVLSSNRGSDFAALLQGLAQLGYGFAYRVLDAQYFGVPQRRRRVFVVGCLGDWRSATKVLFEPESLCRDITPSKEERKGSSGYVQSSFGQYREDRCAGTTKASGGDLGGGSETFLTVYENHGTDSRVKEVDVCPTMTRRWGTGGNNVPLVHGFTQCDAARDIGINVSPTLRSGGSGGYPNHSVQTNMRVRRLTPMECERLQGFPDNYTNIPNAADTNRYKALGNSMAVPVMRWIGERIHHLSNITTVS